MTGPAKKFVVETRDLKAKPLSLDELMVINKRIDEITEEIKNMHKNTSPTSSDITRAFELLEESTHYENLLRDNLFATIVRTAPEFKEISMQDQSTKKGQTYH